jgi:uncharacterized protein (UPF0335 family)
MSQESSIVAAEKLTQFIERAEQLASEKAGVADQEKELFAEAKSFGLDVKVMRKIIRDRKMARDALAEFESVEEVYRAALGMV